MRLHSEKTVEFSFRIHSPHQHWNYALQDFDTLELFYDKFIGSRYLKVPKYLEDVFRVGMAVRINRIKQSPICGKLYDHEMLANKWHECHREVWIRYIFLYCKNKCGGFLTSHVKSRVNILFHYSIS